MTMKSLRAQSKAGAASKLSRMSRFAKGGKVTDGDADDKPTAKPKRIAQMMVDGKPARGRLDRPGRRMRREEGGKVTQGGFAGDLDSGRPKKELSASEDRKAKSDITKGAVESVLGAALTGYGRRFGKLPGIGVLGAGLSNVGSGLARSTDARHLNDEADKAEGHKHGGRAKR